MEKLKKHLSLSEQVNLLKRRGLIIDDSNEAMQTLFSINYYRLSGYLHDFKQPKTDNYIVGFSWKRLKHIYDFDRKLTRILLYALEDIEETLKARLSYTLTAQHPDDPLIYLRPRVYREYNPYIRFLQHFYEAKENNQNLPFIKHHNKKYGGFLPMWVAIELFTMGNLQAVYNNLKPKYQKELAKSYKTGPRQLANWIENLTYTRNHLAHYMRVYNFNFGRTPMDCKNHLRTFSTSGMIFDQIYIMYCMYSKIDEWNNYILSDMLSLIEQYKDDIELPGLGFPNNWETILRLN